MQQFDPSFADHLVVESKIVRKNEDDRFRLYMKSSFIPNPSTICYQSIKVLVATAFIVLGNVFLVAFGNHQSPVYTPEQLTEKYTNVAFLLYLLALIVIVVLNHSVYKRGELLIAVSGHELKPFWSMLLPFSYAVVSGAIGSCSVLLNPENLTKFLKGAVVIDITAFVDQDHPFVEVWNPVSEAFAAYLVAKDLVAVAIVQAEIEFVASIAVVALVVVTAVLEMVTNLMHLVVIAAELEPSIAVTRAQSAGLSACLNWQIEVQGPAAAIEQMFGSWKAAACQIAEKIVTDLIVAGSAYLEFPIPEEEMYPSALPGCLFTMTLREVYHTSSCSWLCWTIYTRRLPCSSHEPLSQSLSQGQGSFVFKVWCIVFLVRAVSDKQSIMLDCWRTLWTWLGRAKEKRLMVHGQDNMVCTMGLACNGRNQEKSTTNMKIG
ncbi:hypothetical protein KIW84_073981 [Lathyrus oleraceus]|uniref:Probable magnesium transporter n=1 Tax=Pisum sativum TaxID=3888 RepID=A0A9D4ZZT2_PEA|nr:hypothetical protein KIW84_073981 [Pisum sativum]